VTSYKKQIERVTGNLIGSNLGYQKRTRGLYKHESLSNPQLKILKEFKEYYESKPSTRGGTIKSSSVSLTLNILRRIGVFVKKPYEKVTEDDLIKFVKSLEKGNKSESTIANNKAMVKIFYKWLYNKTKIKALKKILVNELLKPQTPKPSKHRSADNFLTKEEMERFLAHCGSLRNKVLFMLTYGEGGLRAGEISSLNFSSVNIKEYYCEVNIRESKTKPRNVTLVKTFPYLRDYLNNEYCLEKLPDSPLFYSVRDNKRIDRNSITKILRYVGTNAGIKKRIFAHMGRHQAITKMSNDGLNAPLNAKRAGITMDTLNKTYLHHTYEDVKDAVLSINGVMGDKDRIEREREKASLTPKECVRCNKINTATNVMCRCSAYLEMKLAEENRQKREDMEQDFLNNHIKENIEKVTESFISSGKALELLKKIKEK